MRNLAWLFLFSACSDPKTMMPKPMTTPFAVSVIDRSDGTPLANAQVAVDDKKRQTRRRPHRRHRRGHAADRLDPGADVGHRLHDRPRADDLARRHQERHLKTGLPKNGAAPTGTNIMGNILHKNMDSDFVTLSASVHAGYFQDGTSTYSLEIFDNKAFSIYALDWGRRRPQDAVQARHSADVREMAQVEAPAPTAGASFDVDFAAGTALTPVKQSGNHRHPHQQPDRAQPVRRLCHGDRRRLGLLVVPGRAAVHRRRPRRPELRLRPGIRSAGEHHPIRSRNTASAPQPAATPSRSMPPGPLTAPR